LVEQLPHCDLLRLILLTERFVLSVRQVFASVKRIFFTNFCGIAQFCHTFFLSPVVALLSLLATLEFREKGVRKVSTPQLV